MTVQGLFQKYIFLLSSLCLISNVSMFPIIVVAHIILFAAPRQDTEQKKKTYVALYCATYDIAKIKYKFG